MFMEPRDGVLALAAHPLFAFFPDVRIVAPEMRPELPPVAQAREVRMLHLLGSGIVRDPDLELRRIFLAQADHKIVLNARLAEADAVDLARGHLDRRPKLEAVLLQARLIKVDQLVVVAGYRKLRAVNH